MQSATTLDARSRTRKTVKNATKVVSESSPETNRLEENLNTLISGDAVVEMGKMPAECIDLVVTSPPYDNLRDYNGYSFRFEEIAIGLFRVLKQGGVLVWVVGDKINGGRSLTSFRQGIYFQELGFTMHDIMIYRKKNTPFMRSNAYTNAFEFMFVLTKGKPMTFNPLKEKTVRSGPEMLVHNKKADGVNKKVLKDLKKEKTKTNIWSYAVGLGGTTSDKIAFEHPAVFPEQLAMDHILSWTKEGDTVLDPMCGSGTTCKMARKSGRNFIGIDISPEYIGIAKKRMGTVET
jgi:site-specific DNA-methyltransferase (adenine-specific)